MTESEYKYLTYESLDDGTIVRIMLNRPDTRNAQNRGLLVELGRADADVGVRPYTRGREHHVRRRRTASIPTMAALLIKESVNQSVDQMGFYNALNPCFTLHELNHAHWAWIHDNRMPMGLPEDDGISDWQRAG